MKIGVLDIQGSVEEHFEALKKCRVDAVLVKKIVDLKGLNGLIMPGGESTTIGKLLKKYGLGNEIIRLATNGLCIWGTCAGAILLAKKIVGDKKVDNLKLMNIEVERNAYGRQIESFETKIDFNFGENGKVINRRIAAVFIRAPKIKSISKSVQILAKYNDEIVAAKEKNLLVTTFHPELTSDVSIHKYFVSMCER